MNSSVTNTRKRQRHRQLDELDRLSGTECTLSTSFDTKDTGSDAAAGIIFTVQPKQTIDLQTIQFYVSDNNGEKIPNVQVFHRSGDGFTNAINQPSEWQELANADAHIVPGLRPRAIIPASDFISVTLDAGSVHALYVVVPQSSPIKVQIVGGDCMIGSVSSNDDVVDVQIGVSLDSAKTFPANYASVANFNGILHYSLTSECQDIKTSTDVNIDFAVDNEPTDGVIDGLTGAVELAVLEYMNESSILAAFKDFHSLNLQESKTSFQGVSQKCPKKFTVCSLFTTTLTVTHSPALESGEVQLGILGGSKAIEKSVKRQSPVDLVYAGDNMVTLDFLVTLSNTLSGEAMNPIQRQYFESVTMDLLKKAPGPPIHTAVVLDEVLDEVGRRQVLSPFLRGSPPRGLAPSAKTQVLIQVTSSGPISDVETTVLETLDNDDESYLTELVTKHLEPGRISQQNFGEFFADIDLLDVQTKPASFPEEQNEPLEGGFWGANNATGDTSSFSIWVVVCLILIAMSLMTILYRIFKDCCSSPPKRTTKDDILRDEYGADSGTADHLDSNEEVDDDDVHSVGIADLSVGDQESVEDDSSCDEEERQKGMENIKDQSSVESAFGGAADESSGSESESSSLEEASKLSESELNESESEDSEMISRADFEPGLSPSPRRVKKENDPPEGKGDETCPSEEECNDGSLQIAKDDGELSNKEDNGDGNESVSERSNEKGSKLSDDESSGAGIDIVDFESDSFIESPEDESRKSLKRNDEESESESKNPEDESRKPLKKNDEDSDEESTLGSPEDQGEDEAAESLCKGINVAEYESDSDGESSFDASRNLEEKMDVESDDESSLGPFEDQDDSAANTSLSDNQGAAEGFQQSEESEEYISDENTSVDPLDIEDDNVEESCKHITRAPVATPKDKSGQNGRGIKGSKSMLAAKKQTQISNTTQLSNSQHSTKSSTSDQNGSQGRGLVVSKSMPVNKGPHQKISSRKNSQANSQHSRGAESLGSNSALGTKPMLSASQILGTPRNKSGVNGRGIQKCKSMPATKVPPKKHAAFNSQPNKTTGISRNKSGMNGRGMSQSRSLTYHNGSSVKKHPPTKHFPSNSQHSRGAPIRKLSAGLRNQSGMNGRGLQPSRSTPVTPVKHFPRNSDHSTGGESIGSGSSLSGPRNVNSANGRRVAQSNSMPTKKLTPLQASRSSKFVQPKNPPRNQSGMNGRGVAATRSMPIGIVRKAPVKKIPVSSSNDDESELSSITAGNYPKRPASAMIGRSNLKGKAPERKIVRSHSAESSLQQYGKAGKIKFQPRPKPQPILVKMK